MTFCITVFHAYTYFTYLLRKIECCHYSIQRIFRSIFPVKCSNANTARALDTGLLSSPTCFYSYVPVFALIWIALFTLWSIFQLYRPTLFSNFVVLCLVVNSGTSLILHFNLFWTKIKTCGFEDPKLLITFCKCMFFDTTVIFWVWCMFEWDTFLRWGTDYSKEMFSSGCLIASGVIYCRDTTIRKFETTINQIFHEIEYCMS